VSAVPGSRPGSIISVPAIRASPPAPRVTSAGRSRLPRPTTRWRAGRRPSCSPASTGETPGISGARLPAPVLDSGTMLANLLAVAGALGPRRGPDRIRRRRGESAAGVDAAREAALELVRARAQHRARAGRPAASRRGARDPPLSSSEVDYPLIRSIHRHRLCDRPAVRAWRWPGGPMRRWAAIARRFKMMPGAASWRWPPAQGRWARTRRDDPAARLRPGDSGTLPLTGRWSSAPPVGGDAAASRPTCRRTGRPLSGRHAVEGFRPGHTFIGRPRTPSSFSPPETSEPVRVSPWSSRSRRTRRRHLLSGTAQRADRPLRRSRLAWRI